MFVSTGGRGEILSCRILSQLPATVSLRKNSPCCAMAARVADQLLGCSLVVGVVFRP
jgi:hypothetical protein